MSGDAGLRLASLLALAYLCGSIPFGLLIARAVAGADVRAVGSGNIGATNVARAAGRPAALATLVLDTLKGLGPVLLAERLLPGSLAAPGSAVLAVAGHCFPVWLRFRGGKGVATGLGVTLGLAPLAALAGAACWLLLYKLLRISSIGSLTGVVAAVGVAWATAPASAFGALLAISAIIVLRHQGNLRRIFQRQER